MKEIKLTLGKVAVVDDDLFDYLNKWKWTAKKHRNTFYARRNIKLEGGKQKDIKMHRLIMGVTDPSKIIDHRDNNGLNNQRSNLRLCTLSQNQHNRQSNIGASKFKGVWKSKNRWRAEIVSDGTKKRLGSYIKEEEAAKAYNEAALKYHGEFARLNQIPA